MDRYVLEAQAAAGEALLAALEPTDNDADLAAISGWVVTTLDLLEDDPPRHAARSDFAHGDAPTPYDSRQRAADDADAFTYNRHTLEAYLGTLRRILEREL